MTLLLFLHRCKFWFSLIIIHPRDQAKTTFTVLMARIPIGECRLVCNPPTNFQRCMVNIFCDFVEKIGDILFSDFVTYGTSVDHCLYNLTKILQRCKEIDLMLNWELFPFMIRDKTIFGQKFPKRYKFG
jgi:hypothetical protein